MNTVLEVANVEKYYGNKGNLTKALDKISFRVEEGEFVGIMGASGSGKTTLLNCLSTIDRITSGKIVVDDIDITRLKGNHLNRFRREELGFIFQDFNLLDTLTAYENIALELTIQRVKPEKIQKDVERWQSSLELPRFFINIPTKCREDKNREWPVQEPWWRIPGWCSPTNQQGLWIRKLPECCWRASNI